MAEALPRVQLRSASSFTNEPIVNTVQYAKTESSSSGSSSENQLVIGNESANQSTTLRSIVEEEAIVEQQSVTRNSVVNEPTTKVGDLECICRPFDEFFRLEKERKSPEDIQKLLTERENELRAEYKKILRAELDTMRERFSEILRNEQTRASFMLREAHRDRTEKIRALQSQLECKNLAALMYVMCTDRQESNLEKMRIVEEYTNYIKELEAILTEGQNLILHLSRGFKTAARVDHEWREKMKKIVSEFMAYIYHYGGGTLDTVQYYFNLQELMTTKTPLVDDPKENPCEEEEDEELEVESKDQKEWYEQMGDENRPFVMFGDMSGIQPKERRKVLNDIKAKKTAPKKWKEYVFKDMHLKQTCSNQNLIKDASLRRRPEPYKWSCQAVQTQAMCNSGQSLPTGMRNRAWSIDVRNQMGSLLKIMTSQQHPGPMGSLKINLLGAKDSIEISSSKQRDTKERTSNCRDDKEKETVLSIGKNKISCLFEKRIPENDDFPMTPIVSTEYINEMHALDSEQCGEIDEAAEEHPEENTGVYCSLGSVHVDSLHVLQSHSADKDKILHYERACPMEKCQRMKTESFMRQLPPYMRAHPFTHFEQTFEEYELCTPEQLAILKKRLDTKRSDEDLQSQPSSILIDWKLEGMATQTSQETLNPSIPPCVCTDPEAKEDLDMEWGIKFPNLEPAKKLIDQIGQACLYDPQIDFNRFKVVGQENSQQHLDDTNENFETNRYRNIQRILNQHPSLLDIFQANTK